MKRISFSSPNVSNEDIVAVVNVLKSGWITSGSVGEEFAQELAQYLQAEHIFLLNSATAGLFIALKAMGIGMGDEVITTPYTFAATANVIYHTGAEVVFADVKPGSFYLDRDEVYKKITPKTKAIIPVDFSTAHNWNFDHNLLAQYFLPKNEFQEQLKRPLILLDSAHALGSRFIDSSIDMAVYSFHAVKNITTAEGGALALGSLGDQYLDQLLTQQIANYILHGQNKSAKDKFLSGTWEYDISVPGYKFNMPDILAALGLSQFRRYESHTLPYRRKLFIAYQQLLQDNPQIVMDDPDIFQFIDCSSCHLMPIRIQNYSEEQRNQLINYAQSKGVALNVHFKPLHKMNVNRYYKCMESLLHSEKQYQNEISLPLHQEMTLDDVEYVTEVLLSGLNQ
ncbi:MAG: DegT/DnrJ/EryC1/StrS family aminotransferase [Brevinema sp.]